MLLEAQRGIGSGYRRAVLARAARDLEVPWGLAQIVMCLGGDTLRLLVGDPSAQASDSAEIDRETGKVRADESGRARQ